MSENDQPSSHMERLWDAGQRHLAGGHYVAARRELEAAEAIAWRRHDAAALARLYLPLLEARRQIRFLAVEGVIVISDGQDERREQQELDAFMKREAGTFLLSCRTPDIACRCAGSVQYAARQRGSCLESLLVLHEKTGQARLAAQADAHLPAGLAIRTATEPGDVVDADAAISSGDAAIPLPPAGTYDPSNPSDRALHALARESLLVAWEALAMRWQARHPLKFAAPSPEAAWEEIAWLRLALRVDPACEPVAMRIMALAEAIERGG